MPTIVVTLAGDLRIRAHQYVRRTSVGALRGIPHRRGIGVGGGGRGPAGNGNSVRWQIKLRVASNEETDGRPLNPSREPPPVDRGALPACVAARSGRQACSDSVP